MRVGRAGDVNCSQIFGHLIAVGRHPDGVKPEPQVKHKHCCSSLLIVVLSAHCGKSAALSCCINTSIKYSEPFTLIGILQNLNSKLYITSWSNDILHFHSALHLKSPKALFLAYVEITSLAPDCCHLWDRRQQLHLGSGKNQVVHKTV